MSEGYVYVLSNPSMPDLLKIGKTTRDPSQRANELYQTGVPTPFVVEREFFTPDCNVLEALAHKRFDKVRVSQSREFFNASFDDVEMFLAQSVADQITSLAMRYTDCMVLVAEPLAMEISDILRISRDIGLHPYEVMSVFEEVTSDELAGAVSRYKQKLNIRAQRREAGLGVGSLDPDDIAREIEEKQQAQRPLRVVS